MADRMITALQKGRFTTLADMGLIIDKGETVSTMLGKIKDATQQYGDTGFNVADKIGALSEQWERFKIVIGDAINASPEFAKFFTELKDDVVEFIRTLMRLALRSLLTSSLSRLTNCTMVFLGQTLKLALKILPTIWQISTSHSTSTHKALLINSRLQ